MKKRLLAILLGAVMVVSMLPATTFALKVKATTSTDSSKFAVAGTSGENTIALTWGKADKATKYKVYYKKAAAKKFKLARTTKAQALTLRKLARNTAYKAYVVACNKKGKKIVKSATIRITTGNPIAFQDASAEPRTLFEGVIPFDSWAKAVAAGWSFNATVGDETVKSQLIEYSENRVGVLAADGTKFGVFYKGKPRYEYNMVTLKDIVDIGHEYVIGDVWPQPVEGSDLAKEVVKKGIKIVEPLAFNMEGEFEIPHATWSDAADAGWTFEMVMDGTENKIMVEETLYDVNEVVFSFKAKKEASTSNVLAQLQQDNILIKYDGESEIVWGDPRINTGRGYMELEDPIIILDKMRLCSTEDCDVTINTQDADNAIEEGKTYYLGFGTTIIDTEGTEFFVKDYSGDLQAALDETVKIILGDIVYQLFIDEERAYLREYNNEQAQKYYLLDESDSDYLSSSDNLGVGKKYRLTTTPPSIEQGTKESHDA